MSNSIGHVQALLQSGAAENAASKGESSTANVQTANEKKKELDAHIKQLQSELKALQEEMAEINDRSGFEEFMGGLFGSDGGAGEVGDAMATCGAEMKKAQQEIIVKQQGIDMMLQELQAAQGDLGKAVNDNDKIDQEKSQALAAATA